MRTPPLFERRSPRPAPAAPTQLDVFAVAAARASRDSALAKVEEHALESFKEEAYSALRAYLETHPDFFCDDFWLSEEAKRIQAPSNLKAIGGVILRAKHAKLMERSGFRESVASHMSPKPCWKSLIYGGQP